MYCKKRGNLLNEDDKFCTNCGSAVEVKSSVEQNQNVNNVSKKKNVKNVIWVVAGVGLLFLAIFIFIFGIAQGFRSETDFDFSPYGSTFVIICGVDIIFNIIMAIVSSKK